MTFLNFMKKKQKDSSIRQRVGIWTDVVVFGLFLTVIAGVAIGSITQVSERVPKKKAFFSDEDMHGNNGHSFFEEFFVGDSPPSTNVQVKPGKKKQRLSEKDLQEGPSFFDQVFVDSSEPKKSKGKPRKQTAEEEHSATSREETSQRKEYSRQQKRKTKSSSGEPFLKKFFVEDEDVQGENAYKDQPKLKNIKHNKQSRGKKYTPRKESQEEDDTKDNEDIVSFLKNMFVSESEDAPNPRTKQKPQPKHEDFPWDEDVPREGLLQSFKNWFVGDQDTEESNNHQENSNMKWNFEDIFADEVVSSETISKLKSLFSEMFVGVGGDQEAKKAKQTELLNKRGDFFKTERGFKEKKEFSKQGGTSDASYMKLLKAMFVDADPNAIKIHKNAKQRENGNSGDIFAAETGLEDSPRMEALNSVFASGKEEGKRGTIN